MVSSGGVVIRKVVNERELDERVVATGSGTVEHEKWVANDGSTGEGIPTD